MFKNDCFLLQTLNENSVRCKLPGNEVADNSKHEAFALSIFLDPVAIELLK